MKDKAIKLSIIIVNYHVLDELFRCLESIYKSKQNINFEIIVVDNDEKKSIGEDLRKKFPKVKYVKSSGNIGYGAGNNLGSGIARGEYLFILNPDTEFYSGSFSKIVKKFEKDKNIGIIAPVLLDKTANPYLLQGTRELTPRRAIYSLSFLAKLFPKNRVYRDYYFLGWNKKKQKEVDVTPGTAFIIKRELFREIGGFDEKFFLFFEEFDLSRKIRKLGFKIIISPEFKFIHAWGSSTSKNPLTQRHFHDSRFYYFKKNYGFLKGFLTEIILRISKETGILALIILFALFLRLYKISEVMTFIPDVGWFYVSARDMILNGQIPLVGIETSHPWLHQGALWTYILAVILWFSNFHPVIPAYFTSLIDVLTIVLIYIFVKSAFNSRIAFLSASFYSVSSLTILSAHTPYHTSMIPFFVILLLISIFKWVKGNYIFFPISIFLLVILYNLEIATFPFVGIVLLLFLYGFIKNKIWVKKLKQAKLILLSFLSFILPMLPMLIYDIHNGFPQTLKFLAWVGYKFAVMLGYPPLSTSLPPESWGSFMSFSYSYIQRFYFLLSARTALLIFVLSIVFILFKLYKTKLKNPAYNIVFLFVLIPMIAFIAARTNSGAYLPMFFPQLAIMLGIFLGSFRRKYTIVFAGIVLVILTGNMYRFPYRPNADVLFPERIEAMQEIIRKSGNEPYNIVFKGEGKYGENFIKNYQYIGWWLGKEPTVAPEAGKFYIDEVSSKIFIREVKNK